MKNLNNYEKQQIAKGLCPDCGSREWYQGPSGGMTTNYTCAGKDCGHRFNIAIVGSGSVLKNDKTFVIGQRIDDSPSKEGPMDGTSLSAKTVALTSAALIVLTVVEVVAFLAGHFH